MRERLSAAILGGIFIVLGAGCAPAEFTFKEEKPGGQGGAGGAGGAGGDASSSTAGVGGSPTPECGNGKIEAPEACDDGNKVNNDSCSSDCRCGEDGQNVTAFTTTNQHCYVINNVAMTWDNSNTYCQSHGWNLSAITSLDERNTISLLAKDKIVWLGGQDAVTEGVWTWIDLTPWTIHPCMGGSCDDTIDLWNMGEPNPVDNTEDCLALDAGMNGFSDLACTDVESPLCELGAPP